jgi:hypothetical protein
MAENFYEGIESLWKRISSSKSGSVKLNDADRKTILEAFKKAWYHEELLNTSHELNELQGRWDEANKLFHNKDKDGFDYDKALRKAVEILGIDEQATTKGKRKRLHPSKDRELMRDYQALVIFDDIPEDGEDPADLEDPADNKKVSAIKRLYEKYGFSSDERLSRYLREELGLPKVPSMKSHSKKIKKTTPKKHK